MDLWGLFGCNNPTRHRVSSLRPSRFPTFKIISRCHKITFFSPFAPSFTFPPHLHLIHCVFHELCQLFDNCYYCCFDYCFLWLLFQSFCFECPATESQPKPIDDNNCKKKSMPRIEFNWRQQMYEEITARNKFVRKSPQKTKSAVHIWPKRRQKEKFF